jgi:hypothetical protein
LPDAKERVMESLKLANGPKIEMVIVVMANQHVIDRGEIF